jgi:Gnt-I system high-affinity gluconate transporter
LFGIKHIQWGLALAGFVIGIPLFQSAGFVIVVPLIFMISESVKLPMLYVAVPMLSALSVAHGYLPPHPSPSAVALQLNADIGKTLWYGIIVSIPAIAVAGPLFGRTLKKYKPKPSADLFEVKPLPKEQLPGLGISITTALLPVFLLTFMASIKSYFPENTFIQLLAEPYMGMLVAVLFATWALGLKRGKKMPQITKSFEEAFKGISVILLIVAGAGVFKQIMTESGVSTYIADQLKDVDISPLLLSWGIAAIIRVCIGSATVAGLTTVGILAPIIHAADVSVELVVLAIGAGSLMFSHINDGGFWIYKEYFNLSIKDTIMTWSLMETIVSVVGLIGVLLLSLVL